MSDIGGVMSILISIFGLIFRPLSQFLYYSNAIKRLFLARSKNDGILLKSKECCKSSAVEDQMNYYINDKNFPKHLDD